MKTCLVISASFPPYGGIGAQRVTRFVKYMPSYGWRPIVVTTPPGSTREAQDPSLLTELPPDLPVYRPFYYDYRKITRGEVAKWLSPLQNRYLFPDRHKPWNFFAQRTIRRLLREHRVDLLFFDLRPFSTLAMVPVLRRDFGGPIVLTLRDPFSFNMHLDKKDTGRAVELERQAFSSSDSILCVTPFMVGKYKSLFPEIHERFRFLPNGFDRDDFKNLDLEASRQVGTFTIGYNGSVSPVETLRPILVALHRIWVQEGIPIHLSVASKDRLEEVTARYPPAAQAGLIRFHGFLPHRKSLERLTQCHALLLTLVDSPETEGVYTGKVFEYMAMNKPILLMNRKTSDLANLIQHTRTGIVWNINDEEEIAAGVLNLYRQWRNGGIPHDPDQDRISRFDYANLTRELVDHFERVLILRQAASTPTGRPAGSG